MPFNVKRYHKARKEHTMFNSNKGITLLTLTITIVIMLILSFTVSINVSTYVEKKKKTNLETDIIKLQEEIAHYYSKYKTLPIINRYINTDMLEKNVNDNENYYVIELSEMKDLDLNYGKDYEKISDTTIEIQDLLDIYIINERTHTIYYPKGINFSGKIYYTTMNLDSIAIEDIPLSSIEITGETVAQKGETVQLTAKVLPAFVQNTGVTWNSDDETILTVDENGLVTAKKEGTATITATSKDNTVLTATHEITVELNTARYILVDVYGRFGSNAAIISELEIYDENNTKIQYDVVVDEAYDSVTGDIPYYWKHPTGWCYANLYDGETAYTTNSVGCENCAAFIFNGTTTDYARFIIDFGEEKTISDIKVYVGDNDTSLSDGAGGRTPLSISTYKINNYLAHETNNTYSTYYNNVAQRNNNGLQTLGTIDFTERVTTPTGYSLLK